MPTYVYETTPRQPGEVPQRFELIQSMKDAPLKQHPETGEPVRRVITGGYGLIEKAGAKSTAPTPAAPCAPGCACHSGPRVPSF